MSSGVVFPLEPVFSAAVKTSFSFLHESLLYAERNVHHPEYEMICESDIEFGSFSSSLKCEQPCDGMINIAERHPNSGSASASLKGHQVKNVRCWQCFIENA